ncbi:hypothetical protein DPMN_135668 [Dreissena polymorpha]|uniref:Uncharacterized protein n=1 Tax=Dreissena polymorpha TaxID=45954 RepID=A0A9D4FZL2_DREPO|nr:hypothetical protein DPMN_135668 [Dreissena polymorpha]
MISGLGGPIKSLDDLTRTIFRFTIQQNISISARHIAGKDNCHAEKLSRSKYEGRLHPALFGYINRILGTSRGGPFCFNDFRLDPSVQFVIPRSVHIRSGCLRTGLERQEQLCECPFRSYTKSIITGETTRSCGNPNSPKMATSALVQGPNKYVNSTSVVASNIKSNSFCHKRSRATEKSKLEDRFMESMWSTSLRCL